MPTTIPTVIVGAGQAGLALSRCLTDRDHDHVVVERGRIAERWHTQRWDSFRLLTPNWHTRLPGHRYDGPDPDGFMNRADVVAMFQRYAASFRAPVLQDTAVERATRVGDRWQLMTSGGVLTTDSLVVATGPHDQPRIPPVAAALPHEVAQLHAATYRRPEQLSPGAVLVVGAGPSGQQLASELARSGRDVLLAVGSHRWVPRSYRGRDAFWWMERTGASNTTVDELPRTEGRRPGHVVLTAGRDLSLDHLADEGVTLLGRLHAIDGWRAHLGDDLAANRHAAARAAIRFMDTADQHAARTGLDLPDPGPRPSLATPAWAADTPTTVDLRAAGVRTVLWATGYQRDYRWLKAPVVGADGEARHRRGVSPIPGLSFLGLTWQYRRSSASIDGVGHDARYLAEVITQQAARRQNNRSPVPARLAAVGAA